MTHPLTTHEDAEASATRVAIATAAAQARHDANRVDAALLPPRYVGEAAVRAAVRRQLHDEIKHAPRHGTGSVAPWLATTVASLRRAHSESIRREFGPLALRDITVRIGEMTASCVALDTTRRCSLIYLADRYSGSHIPARELDHAIMALQQVRDALRAEQRAVA